jgi:hypothetical protein
MTNEELFYLLQRYFPGTVNGRDYLTGHKLDQDGEQFEEAFISNWKLPQPEPTPEQLQAMWRRFKPEVQAQIKGIHLRWTRNELLLEADARVYKAEDSGDQEALGKARRYRQALRDVPQQPGFPDKVNWPVLEK